MLTRSLKCSLAVLLFACAFLADSGVCATNNGGNSGAFSSVSTGAYSGADTSALSSTSALDETENISGAHDRHKGIRSYDSTGFPHGNNANRGVKSYGTPSGHGASHDHGIKSGGHGYNKNSDGCSRCKWENDEYWERDEPEEEGDENDGDECDDGDDGQYKPDKAHHHGRGRKPGSHPSGVHKTGPTNVYVDDEVKGEGRPGGPLYPTGTRPISGYETTPKPGSGWNTPFADTSKPGSVTAGAFGTTPSSWPDWNRGTTPGSFGSPSKPAWGGGHDGTPAGGFGTTPKAETSWNTRPSAPTGRFPSPQRPGAPVANFGATAKPGQGWNTGPDGVPTAGFPSSRKPAPNWNANRDSTPAGSFGVTPKPGSSWPNAGYDSTGGFPSSSKPGAPWSTGHDGGNFGTTPKPGQGWNTGLDGRPGSNWNPGHGTTSVDTSGCTQSDSGCSQGKQVPVKVGATPIDIGQTQSGQFPSGTSAVSYMGSGISSPSNYGNPQENQNRPYGQPGTQSTYAGAYAGASVTSGIGSPYGGAPNFGKKDHPFGFNKPVQTPRGPYGGTDQTPSNIYSGTYGSGSTPNYNKPGQGTGPHSTWPTTVANTLGSTKGSYGGISSPGTVPRVQGSTFTPGISPGSPTGSGVYGHPGVTKPSYGGSTSSWLNTGQTGSGNSAWYGTGTSSPGFPVSNTGFGTTKTPLSHVSIPSSTLSALYDRMGPKQPVFNVASSSATANAGASAFGTSPGIHSTPSVTGATSFYGTTPAHTGGSSYTPEVKGSSGDTRPPYGTIPHGTHPNTGSGTWSRGQPGSNGPWSSGKPGDGSGITPDRHFPGASGTWPGKQPEGGSGTWPIGQPGSGSGTAWPNKQPGDGSGTWSGQGQPGHGSGCSSVNCGGAAGPEGSSSCGGCCGNYNCDSGCSGRGDNVPTTHGLCGAAVGPSGVNKTYYPGGTGDGNISNIGPIYGPGSPVNNGIGTPNGIGHPGINQGANVTPGGPVQWNTANPFLFGAGGGTPSSVSHPWTETTNKPIGMGNPFLDSSWSKPEYGISNANNVIPHEEGYTKPIGQGNPFLDGSNRRGDINVNPVEGVIPLGGKKPEGSNPFLQSFGSGSSGSGSPSYGRYPDGSTTSGISLGSGIAGSNPFLKPSGGGGGSGDPTYGGHPDGSETPGSSLGSGIPGSNPFLGSFGSGTSGSGSSSYGVHPDGSRTPGNSLGPITPGSSLGSGTPGSSLGPGAPGNSLGSGTPGNSFGSGTPGNGGYRGVKGGFHPGGASPQDGNSGGLYPTGGNPQGLGPLQCKLGLFGCGTSGSGSYAGDKQPGGAFGGVGGNVGTGTGNPGGVKNISGGPGNPEIGPASGHFAAGAGHPVSGGSNLAASDGGAHAGGYAGSFSAAQASSSSFAGAVSGTAGPVNNIGGNWSPSEAQNQGGDNPWASSGASAFASSSSGSWSGNRPINVKG